MKSPIKYDGAVPCMSEIATYSIFLGNFKVKFYGVRYIYYYCFKCLSNNYFLTILSLISCDYSKSYNPDSKYSSL